MAKKKKNDLYVSTQKDVLADKDAGKNHTAEKLLRIFAAVIAILLTIFIVMFMFHLLLPQFDMFDTIKKLFTGQLWSLKIK